MKWKQTRQTTEPTALAIMKFSFLDYVTLNTYQNHGSAFDHPDNQILWALPASLIQLAAFPAS